MQFASPKTEKEIRNRSVSNEHIFDACSFSDAPCFAPPLSLSLFLLFYVQVSHFFLCLPCSFVHIHSYLKIYGVINVDFCVNCETVLLFFFLSSACIVFIVSIQWRKTIKSVSISHPFEIPHSFALRAFHDCQTNSVACRQNVQQSFFPMANVMYIVQREYTLNVHYTQTHTHIDADTNTLTFNRNIYRKHVLV